jgi:hypothetical protein
VISPSFSLLDGPIARVARRLSIFCRLRCAPDPCGRNSGASPSTWQWMHTFVRCFCRLGTRRKLSRTAHGESSARGFDVRSPRLQLLQAMDLPVHPLQGGGEYLLALQRMLGCARKALSPRRPLSARFTPLCARQCTLFVAHVAQALAQSLEVIKPSLINFGMMAAQDDPVLVKAEDPALELAGYGHEMSSWRRRTAASRPRVAALIRAAVSFASCLLEASVHHG